MITPAEAANNLATTLGAVSLGFAVVAVLAGVVAMTAPHRRKPATTVAGVSMVFLVLFAFLAVAALVVGPWVLG